MRTHRHTRIRRQERRAEIEKGLDYWRTFGGRQDAETRAADPVQAGYITDDDGKPLAWLDRGER